MSPWEEWLNWIMTVFGVMILTATLIIITSVPFALLGSFVVSLINMTGIGFPSTFISSACVGVVISYIIYRVVTR